MHTLCRSIALIAASLSTALGVSRAFAYGAEGHKLVGAIADARLAGTPAAERVKQLLDGMTLEEASVLPDRIKAWDRKPPSNPDAFHLKAHPKIEQDLIVFWESNKPGGNDQEHPSHHWFHYADISILPSGTEYAEWRKGASKWDIVHMIPYCVRVLRGDQPDTNERGITKPVALILIAHYVGDLHQPLHVGAAYFDASGLADPEKTEAYPDQGGNLVTLLLDQPTADGGTKEVHTKLHAYWDDNAVQTARRLLRTEVEHEQERRSQEFDDNDLHPVHRRGKPVSDDEVIAYLAKHEPSHWKDGSDESIYRWASVWATQIMPLATKAHVRLDFIDIKVTGGREPVVHVTAEEKKPRPDSLSYAEWAGRETGQELHKAGWRLAEMVRRALN